jgi:hypothetical protein
MKIYLPTNPLWYFAVIILVLPTVYLTLVHDHWLVRMVAYGSLVLGVPVILTSLALKKDLHSYISDDAPLTRKFGKDVVVHAWRVFIILIAALFSIQLVPNFAKDMVFVAKAHTPSTVNGTVVDKNANALSVFFYQRIILNDSSQSEGNYGAFEFPLSFFIVGQSYKIMFLPYSRIILDAKNNNVP